MIYVITRAAPEELAHYGIKGQEWGVRRWQYQDGSLTPEGRIHYGVNQDDLDKQMKKGIRDRRLDQAHTIPKGTKIYRTTSTENDSDTGTTYVSYMDVDRQHYKGGWIRDTGKTGKAYEHVYEAQEDIKVPSQQEVKEVVSKIMSENKKAVNETCKAWLDVAVPEGSWDRAEEIWNRINDDTEEEKKRAWKEYTNETIERYKNMTPDEAVFFTMQSLGLNNNVRKKIIDELSSRGYNAMTDIASVGGKNGWMKEGGDPLIIFDRTNMFRNISSKEIDRREEAKSSSQYDKIIRKARAQGRSW